MGSCCPLQQRQCSVIPSHIIEDPATRSHLIATEKLKQVPTLQLSVSYLYQRRKSSSKASEEQSFAEAD